MTHSNCISLMALADIIAYVKKKKKVLSSQFPATTAVKTSVSLQVKISKSILYSFYGIALLKIFYICCVLLLFF